MLPFKPLPEEPHVRALRKHGWQRVSGGHRSRDEQTWTHPDLPGHLITFERDYDDDIELRPNATRRRHRVAGTMTRKPGGFRSSKPPRFPWPPSQCAASSAWRRSSWCSRSWHAIALIVGELRVRTSIWHAIALIAGELLVRTPIWHANNPFFCLQAGERES